MSAAEQGRTQPSIKKNFALSSLWQILQIASPFITAPYISRVLQPDGVGVYSYTRSVQMYFSLFAVLGTTAYGAREVSRERDDRERLSQTFWEIEMLSVITSSVVIAAWIFFALYAGKEYKVIYLILTMGLFSSMLDISWLYAGLEQFKYIVAKNSFFQVLGIVLQFVLVRGKDDLLVYVAVMAGTALLGNLSMWLPLRRFVSAPAFGMLRLGRHFRETLVYFIPAVATSLYTLLDKILIGALTKNPDENGFYEQATQVVNVGKIITFAAVNQVVGSRIAYLHKEKKFDEIRARIDTSCRYIFFMGSAVAFGIAAVSDTFVPWFFGERFAGAAPLLRMLCPLIVIIGLSGLLGSHWYTPAGLRGKSALFIVAGAAVNIVLTVVLIPRFGALGAAVGTFCAELVITLLYVAFCSGNLTPAQMLRNGWRNVLSGLVMFLAVRAMRSWDVGEPLRLLVQVCAGALIYGAALFLLRDTFVTAQLKRVIGKTRRKSA